LIFVDTNVFMYAVGRPHPLQAEARLFFGASLAARQKLVTSALVEACTTSIWPLEAEDIRLARA
jgi:predicted nucleic acid-binding protein